MKELMEGQGDRGRLDLCTKKNGNFNSSSTSTGLLVVGFLDNGTTTLADLVVGLGRDRRIAPLSRSIVAVGKDSEHAWRKQTLSPTKRG